MIGTKRAILEKQVRHMIINQCDDGDIMSPVVS